MYRVIDSVADTELLQSDLRKLESWEWEWVIEFAPAKKNNSVVIYYKIHDHCVDQVEEAKYLGVTLDKK